MNNFIPYRDIQNYNGSFFPSTVHTWKNPTTEYYTRFFTQKAMSLFKFNVPDNICMDYFLYNIFIPGYVCVFWTPEFGIVAQFCGFIEWDIYYNPKKAIIHNQFFNETRTIGKDCVIFKLEPDYMGAYDLIQKYAELMGQASMGISMSYLNSAVSRIVVTENRKTAEEAKKLYDKVFSGEPVVYTKKSQEDTMLTEKPKDNFIVLEILDSMVKIKEMFDTELGIPSYNSTKKERLVEDEVNKMDFNTISRSSLWLNSLNESCEKANEMFGTNRFNVSRRTNENS